MTEKEKMIAGKVYNCLDEELSTALRKAKQLCHKYNDIFFEYYFIFREFSLSSLVFFILCCFSNYISLIY